MNVNKHIETEDNIEVLLNTNQQTQKHAKDIAYTNLSGTAKSQ